MLAELCSFICRSLSRKGGRARHFHNRLESNCCEVMKFFCLKCIDLISLPLSSSRWLHEAVRNRFVALEEKFFMVHGAQWFWFGQSSSQAFSYYSHHPMVYTSDPEDRFDSGLPSHPSRSSCPHFVYLHCHPHFVTIISFVKLSPAAPATSALSLSVLLYHFLFAPGSKTSSHSTWSHHTS